MTIYYCKNKKKIKNIPPSKEKYMTRPIQIGDLVDVKGLNSDFHQIYIIGDISGRNDIIIYKKESPNEQFLLLDVGYTWKIQGLEIPHNITFSPSSLSTLTSQLSSLSLSIPQPPPSTLISPSVNAPLEIWKEIALFLPTVKKVLNFCRSSGKTEICIDVHFWNQWDSYHPSHSEWIFGEKVNLWYRLGDAPEDAKLLYPISNGPIKVKSVTEDDLDTIVSDKPFMVVDNRYIQGESLNFDIKSNPETGIKGITLRDFLEQIDSQYDDVYDKYYPEKPAGDFFYGIDKNMEIIWDHP